MAGDDFLELRAILLKFVAEFLRPGKSGEGRNHVPVTVKGLLFCDALPSGHWNGEAAHSEQEAFPKQDPNPKCIKKVMNSST